VFSKFVEGLSISEETPKFVGRLAMLRLNEEQLTIDIHAKARVSEHVITDAGGLEQQFYLLVRGFHQIGSSLENLD
jgi:hypothetical protein